MGIRGRRWAPRKGLFGEGEMGADGWVDWGNIMVWLRISGLAALIAGVLSLSFIPMYGRHVALGSVALITVGRLPSPSG